MEIKESDMSNYELSSWEKIKNNNNNFFSNLSESDIDTFANINESFYSLTGEKMDDSKLKHNNMDPFFIKKTQNTNIENYIIDNDKSVNKLYNNKREVTRDNFFSPDKNIDNINGSTFQYEVLKNRKNESVLNLNNNVFPKIGRAHV